MVEHKAQLRNLCENQIMTEPRISFARAETFLRLLLQNQECLRQFDHNALSTSIPFQHLTLFPSLNPNHHLHLSLTLTPQFFSRSSLLYHSLLPLSSPSAPALTLPGRKGMWRVGSVYVRDTRHGQTDRRFGSAVQN